MLTEERQYFKPFEYPWAFDYYVKQQQMHWLPTEVPMADDIYDWNKKLTPEEKNLITQILRFFVQGDIDIASGYIDRYLSHFKQPEIRMMLTTFAAMEAVHVHAYSHLLDTIGLPETEYKAFKDYQEMVEKHEYLFEKNNYRETKKIALDLAKFSAFGEGLQLFSSFLILMNFQRFGKLRGLGQIVAWSVKDECYSDDTEILTTKGWKLFSDLTYDDKVAQFNKDTKEISFIYPKKIVSYGSDNETRTMSELSYDKRNHINFKVTPNHTKLVYKNGVAEVCEAKDLKTHHRKKLPVSGYKINGDLTEFTPLDALKVALQADGSIPSGENRTGEKCGYRRATFSFSKERKINRFLSLVEKTGTDLNEIKPDRKNRLFTFDFEPSVTKKFSSWIDLEKVTSSWGNDFLREIVEWDGHKISEDKFYYSTVDPENADFVQAIASISGWRTTRSVQTDDRKTSYKDVHKVYFSKQDTFALSQDVPIKEVDYVGKVWCVESETGFLVVRRNNSVCVSGNTLHCEAMIKLFNTFIDENPNLWNDAFKKEIYQTCRDMVDLEDKFIDLAFELGPVEGLEKDDVKQYIRYIADRRLLQLKLKPNYGVKHNPVPWFEETLNGTEHANFFENRVTEYSKGVSRGDWSEAF